MVEEKRTIMIADRPLDIPKTYVKFYDTYIGTSLEASAVYFLCVEYDADTIEEAVSGKSDEELIKTILAWADMEISAMGVGLADVQ